MAHDPRINKKRTLTANEILQDRAIRHAHFLERLKGHEAAFVLDHLDKKVFPLLAAEVAKRLPKITARGPRSGAFTARRAVELKQEVAEIIRVGYRELYGIERKRLTAISATEAEWQAKVLKHSTQPIGIEFATPNIPALRSMVTRSPFEGRILSEWYRGLGAGLQRGIQDSIATGIATGRTTQQITRDLQRVGITARRHAETIARTSVTHVSAQARNMTAEENTDVVKAEKWVATLDSRTTDICASLDGQVFKVDEGQRPPAHMRCRSTMTPVLKTWEEMGIKGLKEAPEGSRAARFTGKDAPKVQRAVEAEMAKGASRSQALKRIRTKFGGQVPASTTYLDWIKTQPKAVQQQVLGVKKAELFRSGKLSIEKFVDRKNNRFFTLDQLRKREGLDV